jgi:S-methylmethionine-dependent homocysteine/selenocysteine methylase
MINCAHPTHFESVIESSWAQRLRGIRANASKCSHAELDQTTELDDGNRSSLAFKIAISAVASAKSTCWAAAAAPITATSSRSA